MPSSATISSFYSFNPNTKARSSQVNANFALFRGHVIPIDPNTQTAATTNTYDLGVDDHRWRTSYLKSIDLYSSTTTAGLILIGDLTNTTGAYLFKIGNTITGKVAADGWDGQYFKKNSIVQNQSYLMPVGSIMAFAGSSTPSSGGWLLCDGSEISRTTYADLFAVIGVEYGTPSTSTAFLIPDYRGRFLRGVDHGAARDPDRASRTAMNVGGNTGDTVGSVQVEQLKNHQNTIAVEFGGSNNANTKIAATAGDGTGGTLNTNSSGGGNETRPLNAYVNYIIKF